MSTSISKNFYDISIIPKNWTEKRLKNILSISENKSSNFNNEKILSLTKKGIVINDISSNKGQIAESYEKYIKVKKGQICMNPMDLLSGWVDISNFEGLISPAYYTFELNEEVDNKFINYFLQSNYLRKTFFKLGKGVASHDNFGRWVLTPDELKNICLFIPNIEEQKLISHYLDKKTENINKLIDKIHKKIELLQEQRTELINKCVTKGLDPNVEMKDSGVEWIGDIPKHWDVTKLKYHGSVLIGVSFDKEDIVDQNEGTLVLRSSNVQNGEVSFSDNIWVKSKVPENLFVQTGDILICSRNGSRNLIGKNCLLGKESLGMTWGVFMSVFRTKHPNFFHWMLNSQVFKSQSGLYLTSTINQLTVSTLENLKFPYVADPIEQQKIHDFLSKKISLFDKLIKKENNKLILLKEYRQSLISSVVTGKMRVMENMT